MNEKYKSIINQVHHQSAVRPRMSMYDRAAQFSSFAALTGHGDAIQEEARLVSRKEELTEEQMRELNDMVRYICENIETMPQVKITYFIPDTKKEGGSYSCVLCHIRKVDLVKRTVILCEDKREICFDNIYKITSV